MKKGIPIIFFVLVLLTAGWFVHAKLNAPKPITPHPQGNQSNVSPEKGSKNTDEDQEDLLLVYDILGKSNNLSSDQWNAMQQWRSEAKAAAINNPGQVFINGDSKRMRVALTFDDGPDETITPQVLDILKQYQVKATFFLKGNQLNTFPDLVQRMVADDNQIASHAYSHQELNKMNQNDIDKEIIASDQVFIKTIGSAPAMIRPPFGAINQDVLAVCGQEKEKVILWSIDTLDWSQPEADHIAQNVLDNVRPGEIILLHSCKDRQATVQALPAIIEGLQEKGYQMVTLSELLQLPAYK